MKLRFIHFGLPKDIADLYDLSSHVEENGYMEIVTVASRNKVLEFAKRLFPDIMDYAEGTKKLKQIVEIKGLEYDNIKLEIDFNGPRKTINLSDLTKIRGYYDISDKVTIGENGHPTLESIREEALNYLRYLNGAIGRLDENAE